MDRRTFLAVSAAAAGGAVLGFSGKALGRTGLNRAGALGSAGPVMPWDDHGRGIRVTSGRVQGGNVLLLVSGGSALVVDSKFPAFAVGIRADAAEAAGPGGSITLVNTHHHADHTGGNMVFAADTARYGHENLVARMPAQAESFAVSVQGASRQAQGSGIEGLAALVEAAAEGGGLEVSPRSITPVNPVVGRAVTPIEVGGLGVTVRHVGPGHTDNDLIVLAQGPNALHCGDLIFNGLHPFFDASGGATPFGWLESLAVAKGLCDAQTVVIPGHGPVGDRSIIDRQITYHEKLIAAVEKEIDSGTKKEDAVTKRFDFFDGLGFERLAGQAIGVTYDAVLAKRGG